MRHANILALSLLSLVALARCTARPPAPILRLPPGVGDAAAAAAGARATVTAFVAAEAEGAESADTLLAAGADFVATGVVVTTRPRLAGMIGRGEGTIEEARTQLAGDWAWVVVVYRWVGRTPESAERARATVVLERRQAGWRIRHVHSSMVERWE